MSFRCKSIGVSICVSMYVVYIFDVFYVLQMKLSINYGNNSYLIFCLMYFSTLVTWTHIDFSHFLGHNFSIFCDCALMDKLEHVFYLHGRTYLG
jgi:hypothetical protein